jgi:hypothetical protein
MIRGCLVRRLVRGPQPRVIFPTMHRITFPLNFIVFKSDSSPSKRRCPIARATVILSSNECKIAPDPGRRAERQQRDADAANDPSSAHGGDYTRWECAAEIRRMLRRELRTVPRTFRAEGTGKRGQSARTKRSLKGQCISWPSGRGCRLRGRGRVVHCRRHLFISKPTVTGFVLTFRGAMLLTR